MKGHRKACVSLLFLLFFLFVCCKKESALSYERPLFTTNHILKDEYLGLYFQDKKMGYFHGSAYEIDMSGKKGFFLSGDAVIKVLLEKESLYTILKEEIILDEDFKTVYFNYEQKIGESSLNIVAKKGDDNNYKMKSTSSGKSEEMVIKENFLPLAAAGFIVWKKGISENKKYDFKVFVETMQKSEHLSITVGKKVVEKGQIIYPLHQKLGNITITSYVLENGDTYKEESIQGFTMKRISKEEAGKFDENSPSFYDLFSFSLIPIDRDLNKPFKEVTFILSIPDSNVSIPDGDYQKVEKIDSGFKITLSNTPLAKSSKNLNLTPYLSNTMKIQSEAPQIKDVAKNITKNAKNDEEKVKIVIDWVNKNINKRLKDKSTALDVLVSREGECEAHAMLVAALLRSLKIPTKIVGGIVYSKEYNGLLYHAWNEVYLDNHFIPADATFGEFPARPYHLKLTEENNMEDIIIFLGKIKIKVIDVK